MPLLGLITQFTANSFTKLNLSKELFSDIRLCDSRIPCITELLPVLIDTIRWISYSFEFLRKCSRRNYFVNELCLLPPWNQYICICFENILLGGLLGGNKSNCICYKCAQSTSPHSIWLNLWKTPHLFNSTCFSPKILIYTFRLGLLISIYFYCHSVSNVSVNTRHKAYAILLKSKMYFILRLLASKDSNKKFQEGFK